MSIFQTFLRFDIVLTFNPPLQSHIFMAKAIICRSWTDFPRAFPPVFLTGGACFKMSIFKGFSWPMLAPTWRLGSGIPVYGLGNGVCHHRTCCNPISGHPGMIQNDQTSHSSPMAWFRVSFRKSWCETCETIFFSKSNINSQQVGCGISANTIWLWLTVRHGKIHHAINR